MMDGGKEYCIPYPFDDVTWMAACRMQEHAPANPQNTFNFAALSAACSVCFPVTQSFALPLLHRAMT
jgi:hypothetical protein